MVSEEYREIFLYGNESRLEKFYSVIASSLVFAVSVFFVKYLEKEIEIILNSRKYHFAKRKKQIKTLNLPKASDRLVEFFPQEKTYHVSCNFGVSFELHEGESLGVIGPNGAEIDFNETNNQADSG